MDTNGRDENGIADAGLDAPLKVRCDGEGCGCAFFPELQKKREGEIESIFLACPYCGKQYLVAVSDEKLRMDVAEYTHLAEEGRKRRLTERMKKRLHELKERNVARSNELKELYPLEVSGDSEGQMPFAGQETKERADDGEQDDRPLQSHRDIRHLQHGSGPCL